MAAIRERFPLRQARVNRIKLPHYLQLDGGRYLIAAALLLSLMSLITLGQTGRLATKGYEIGRLQRQKTALIREISAAQLRLSEAQSLTQIEQRIKALNLRPATADQVHYMTVDPAAQPPAIDDRQPATDERQPTTDDTAP